ncbi:hypothetical protein ABZ471_44645 [Streptomyces sp. NPDC005728]|uniref:hypothetical protein n=1 Tax=Streptomyces sp. NPDC005728 TaxID=3157054 RepID=UPI0033D62F16
MCTWIVTMPIQTLGGARGHQHYVVEGTDVDNALEEALREAESRVACAHRREALINVQDAIIALAQMDSLQPDVTDLWHSPYGHPSH